MTTPSAHSRSGADRPSQTRELTSAELQRYSRHLSLPGVGVEGQERLKAARVLVVGAGGLGSPASLYLAAAGVGTMGLVDFDRVDVTNLQRQVLYASSDVGQPKLDAASRRLKDLNPHLTLELHGHALKAASALDIISAYDVVVDGTDNFATRYLVNDACVLAKRPNVYGSVSQFEGQASVFAFRGGPCYRCLHPEPPEPGLIPSCAEGGVLGVLPGVVGTVQATEVLKLILGVGDPLVGRFMIYDALRMRFREIVLPKDPLCPVCGEKPTIRQVVDCEHVCGVDTPPVATTTGAAGDGHPVEGSVVTVEQLKTRLDRREGFALLDVREPHELEICAIAGAVNIPLGQLPTRSHELNPAKDVVVFCRSGGRSARAVSMLRGLGFTRCTHVEGGILAWIDRIDPAQQKY